MSTAAAPMPAAPAPTSAPTSAPAGGAPSPAPASPGPAPVSSTSAPQTGTQAPPQAKPRIPWKTRVALDDVGEREVELDLGDYRHRVKIDGEEVELPLADLAKGQERLRASMKRFEEASKIKRQAEERLARAEQVLTDPTKAPQFMRRALGERYAPMLVSEVTRALREGDPVITRGVAEAIKAQLAYEQMPDDQRTAYDQRSRAERELAEQRAHLERQKREIEAAREQEVGRRAEARQRELVAEWVPALERAGLPAMVTGKDGQRQPNARLVSMLADTLRSARESGVPMTLADAVELVREEVEAIVGATRQREQSATLAALEQQPGRQTPQAPKGPPAPPREQRPLTAAELQRQLRESNRAGRFR